MTGSRLVDRVMNDVGMRERAQRAARLMADLDGPGAAAREIARLRPRRAPHHDRAAGQRP